jgi:two-component system, NtrC family, response regulator PilR
MATRPVIPAEHDAATDEAVPRPARVLVADDERSMRELLSIVLRREGYDVLIAADGTTAIAAVERGGVDLVICDVRMPDMTGVEVLRRAKALDPDIDGIFITAFASAETAVEALRLGACDYLTKPFDVDELKIKLRQALERRQLQRENLALKRTLGQAHRFCDIIGSSPAIEAVFKLIAAVAATNSTVLITGESGTGKELAARAIHFHSLRRECAFVPLNCGALPETLLEAELFGHVRGAFTGAHANKKGLLEMAERGTIFLDEIADTSLAMQVKLLRVLQERKFRRVGGTDEIDADIRIITATNRDLLKEVAEGRFREDLYYRINVIPVHLPPLRERREDVALLAQHFVDRYARQLGKRVVGLSREALEALERYRWPGNIRELENAMERAVALERTPAVLLESLPEAVRDEAVPAAAEVVPFRAPGPCLPAEGFDLEAHVQHIEREYLAEALRRSGGVKTRAAELLGMTFRSFRYYSKKYEL